MRLVFAGTPEAAVPSLDAIVASGHEVVAVLTRPDAMVGRGRRLTPSPVAQRANELGLLVLKPERIGDPTLIDTVAALRPDCAPIVAYGGLVPAPLLAVPAHGWVNLHFSLLPAWRGAAPVQRAILHGDDLTGATTFALTEGLDAGPTYGTVVTPIGPRDTAGDLLTRLAIDGAELLVHTLNGIERGDLAPVPQPADGVSVAPKITVDDAHVRWVEPALAVDRRIRACTPAPGAWTTFADGRLGLGVLDPTDPDVNTLDLAPGQVAVTKRSVHVGTGSTPVTLGQVVPQGRRAMAAADWARGVRLTDGQQLL